MEIKNEFFESSGMKHLTTLRNMEGIPITQVFKLTNLVREIEIAAKTYFEVKKGLLDKYGEAGEAGNYKLLPEKIKSFNDEFIPLLAETVEINAKPVEIVEEMKPTADMLIALESVIDTEGLEEKEE